MIDTPAPYGYCPICGAIGLSRERQFMGSDRCENGHTYFSSHAITNTYTAILMHRIAKLESELEKTIKLYNDAARKNEELEERLAIIS